jgi:hypothetical protein
MTMSLIASGTRSWRRCNWGDDVPRVLTARFMHETNTFSRVKTDMALIRRRDFHLENEIPQAFRGSRSALGATFEAADKYGGPSFIRSRPTRTLEGARPRAFGRAVSDPCPRRLSRCFRRRVAGRHGRGAGDPVVRSPNLRQAIFWQFIAITSRLLTRLGQIARNAFSISVQPTDIVLGAGVTVVRGHAEPTHRLAIVPRHTPAVVVQYPNLVLGEGIALIRDLTEPAHRLAVVLRHTPSVFVEHPDITLGLDNSLVGGFAEPADRFAIVLCHPSSVTVEHPDFVLREGISLVCRRTYQRIASP